MRELIEDVNALPVEQRVLLIDSLLRGLSAPTAEIDEARAEVARQRLEELRSGHVQAIPGDQALARLRQRFPR